jgi:hypothetical protein
MVCRTKIDLLGRGPQGFRQGRLDMGVTQCSTHDSNQVGEHLVAGRDVSPSELGHLPDRFETRSVHGLVSWA